MRFSEYIKKNIFKIVIIPISVLVFTGCNTLMSMVSDTNILGRHYFGALKTKQLDSLLVTMDKKYKGNYKETMRKKPYIFGLCVAHEVEKASPQNSYVSYADWSNLIAEDQDINVATFGVRSLVVSDGTFDKLNYSQDAAAFIIAHQVAHSLLNHTNELLYKKDKPEGVSNLLEAYVNNTNNFVEFAMAVNGTPINLKSALPYSEEMEDEADKVALEMIAYAGFNPSNAIIYMQNFIDSNDSTYFTVHPMTQKRFEKLMKALGGTVKMQAIAGKHGHKPDCENL